MRALLRCLLGVGVDCSAEWSEQLLIGFFQEVYIMQQCSFDRNIVQFYGAIFFLSPLDWTDQPSITCKPALPVDCSVLLLADGFVGYILLFIVPYC